MPPESFKKPALALFDQWALENQPGQVRDILAQWRKRIPCILWLRRELTKKSQWENSFDRVYDCGGSLMDYAVDWNEHNPNKRQKDRAGVAIFLRESDIDDKLLNALIPWCRRQELNLYLAGGSDGKAIVKHRDLLLSFCGFLPDPELIDADSSKLVFIMAGTIENQSIRNRMAHGQVVFIVHPDGGSLVTYNPLTGEKEGMSDLLTRCREHGAADKLSAFALRHIARNCSPAAQWGRIYSDLRKYVPPKLSLVSCTMRPHFLEKILSNYDRQTYPNKELIIIFHTDEKIKCLSRRIGRRKNIRVFQQSPQSISFGCCLNYGFSKAKGTYMAKLDDDDHYGAEYFHDLIDSLQYSGTLVSGNVSMYFYIEANNTLILRKPGCEYTPVAFLPGASLLFHRSVFEKVKFRAANRNIDGFFGTDCKAADIKFYSAGRFNLLINRASDKHMHTWKADDSFILREGLPVYPEIDDQLGETRAYAQDITPIEYEKALSLVEV